VLVTSEAVPPTQPPAATLVTARVTPEAQVLASQLRRDALRVEVSDADVLRRPAEPRVYVFCFDAALGSAIAPTVVKWAEDRAGLIGVIEDGAGRDREALLEAGFDDVVAGRVSSRELSARVRAVHRRLGWRRPRAGRLRFGMFTLDLHAHALWTGGQSISLTAIELAVIRALIEAQGKPLSRAQLLDTAWQDSDFDVSERAVDNVILRLRRKLPDPEALETVRSVGFRLVG
jgi:DNA-binding response OmpR family regulator